MGFFDLLAAAMPWETVEAEAPEEKEEKDDGEVCSFLFLEMGGWLSRAGKGAVG